MGDVKYKRCIDDKEWTPVELSSLILKKLRNDCSKDHGQVKDVVISVPAHFDEIRRKATMDAGKLAGLNVIGIINEPVAAALYYAATQSVNGKIMIYDLGGGTFDVTIMNVQGDNIDIICSQGNHQLGGVDFDKKIFDSMYKKYKDQTKNELAASEEENAKYEDEAEDIKKTLSRRKTAKKMLYGQAGNMRFELTREDFEETVNDLLNQTDMLIDVALEEANLKPSDIDKVLLVGGSTRMPSIQQRLENKFGYAPDTSVNVDECVALGAAISAGLIMLRENPEQVDAGVSGGLKALKLRDVCNHSYGTLCAPVDNETGKRVIANRVILDKNTPLPCQSTQTFYTMRDSQDQIEIIVTQGEETDPRFVNIIAERNLELPADRAAGCPIKVKYSYDLNQRMHCSFEDVASGKVLEVDLSPEEFGQISEENISEKVKELAEVRVE